jgi:hypothetical protein
MMEWVTENPCIGLTALIKKIYEKYNIKVPYMRVYYGKEMALDKIYGPMTFSYCTHSKLKWRKLVREVLLRLISTRYNIK